MKVNLYIYCGLQGFTGSSVQNIVAQFCPCYNHTEINARNHFNEAKTNPSPGPKEYTQNFKIRSCISWLTLTIYPSSAYMSLSTMKFVMIYFQNQPMYANFLYFDFLYCYQVTWLSQRELQCPRQGGWN